MTRILLLPEIALCAAVSIGAVLLCYVTGRWREPYPMYLVRCAFWQDRLEAQWKNQS